MKEYPPPQVTCSVSYLDSLACSGLAKLTEALPCLKQPELLAETRLLVSDTKVIALFALNLLCVDQLAESSKF